MAEALPLRNGDGLDARADGGLDPDIFALNLTWLLKAREAAGSDPRKAALGLRAGREVCGGIAQRVDIRAATSGAVPRPAVSPALPCAVLVRLRQGTAERGGLPSANAVDRARYPERGGANCVAEIPHPGAKRR